MIFEVYEELIKIMLSHGQAVLQDLMVATMQLLAVVNVIILNELFENLFLGIML
jgi:hypothetical protein